MNSEFRLGEPQFSAPDVTDRLGTDEPEPAVGILDLSLGLRR
jgi:hypothetical protein